VKTAQLEVHPATRDRWNDMVELFSRRGPRGGSQNSPAAGCWCMYWRRRSNGDVALNKRRMSAIVRAGKEPGLLAYRDGVPVGWISVAPREEFEVLLRSPQYRPRDEDVGVWSIVCFTIDRDARRRGVAAALLEAAVEHAFVRGASAVEAYPHVSNGEDYMGSLRLYERARFIRVRDASKRAVYRRTP
jgi:ribosomal protein S18 acetylase RimI-like enzyme